MILSRLGAGSSSKRDALHHHTCSMRGASRPICHLETVLYLRPPVPYVTNLSRDSLARICYAGTMHPDLERATRLLLTIAGLGDEHIEMSSAGPAKYYTIYRAITFDDCAQHLQGRKARGASLRHPAHMTRALAFDADAYRMYPGWWWLQGVAQQLADAGYRVLLEPSPSHRGGHLWIIFSDLVDARAARCHVCRVAPVLADVCEYWPGPEWAVKWNKVRLPGGKYVSSEMSAWCRLYDVNGVELACDGLSAARVLLDVQTPASIVPPLPADYQEPQHPSRDNDRRRGQVERPALQLQPRSGTRKPFTPDAQQERKYGQVNKFLWFQFSPRQIADWYNERNSVDDLLDFDRNSMANAEQIGRPERTPSLGATRDRLHWADFGAAARQLDGRPDGGDVLELLTRVSPDSKAEILRQLGQIMVAEARTELECAAQRGVGPPAWVAQIMSEAGWTHYWRVRNGQKGKRDHQGA
jgi:hypothetical protein